MEGNIAKQNNNITVQSMTVALSLGSRQCKKSERPWRDGLAQAELKGILLTVTSGLTLGNNIKGFSKRPDREELFKTSL